MRQKTKPSLVQIMACRLFCAKPLTEPMLICCQFKQVRLKMSSVKWRTFYLGLSVLMCLTPYLFCWLNGKIIQQGIGIFLQLIINAFSLPRGRLNMKMSSGKDGLYIETGPRTRFLSLFQNCLRQQKSNIALSLDNFVFCLCLSNSILDRC